MATDFDYGALAKAMNDALTYDEAATIAREQIEAAFVPKDGLRLLHHTFPGKAELTARAEAAEAEVARLREAVRLLKAYCDPSDHYGCEHGFRPATSCPNASCEEATLHRVLNALGDAQ